MEVRKVKVTPELAKFYLSKNTENRNIQRNYVATLAGVMEKEQWIEDSGDTIKFAGDLDILIDGQHRLTALILADISLNMHIATKCDANAFTVLDTGKKRSPKDVIDISELNIKNATVLASAIRMFIIRKTNKVGDTLKTSDKGVNRSSISNIDILDNVAYLDKKYDLNELTNLVITVYRRSIKTFPLKELYAQTLLYLEKDVFTENEIHYLLSQIDNNHIFTDYFKSLKLKSITLKNSEVTDVIAYLFYCLKKDAMPSVIRNRSYNDKFAKMNPSK